MTWDDVFHLGFDAGYDAGKTDAAPAWRYALGQQVQCAQQPWTIVARRWVERQIMPPYAEYLLQPLGGALRCWHVEADLIPVREEDMP